jgi:hypothetical protein
MVKLETRLAEFSTAVPPAGRKLQVLCLDKSGTYELPFPCTWNPTAGNWMNQETPIEVQVVGWREMPSQMIKSRAQ